MSIKRAYRLVKVNKITAESLIEKSISLGDAGVCVGLDIGKSEIVAVVCWGQNTFSRPWSVKNPSELSQLVTLLLVLKDACDSLTIGLESTGTYGDPIRAAMTQANLTVHRVSGKAVADYKEIFDGVPSQHDGKDAAMIAELTRHGKGTLWPYTPLSDSDQVINYYHLRLVAYQKQETMWIGRLEGILGRHWPELLRLLDSKGVTLGKLLVCYGSPDALAADPEARAKLRRWGGSLLTWTKIDAVLESARSTTGVPMTAMDKVWLQEIVTALRQAMIPIQDCEKKMKEIALAHPQLSRYVPALGAGTLLTLWATVGDPRKYDSSGAYLKALGLNLKELSSGNRKGEMAITKRGPGRARHVLYFLAMRSLSQPCLKQWFGEARRVGRRGSSKQRSMEAMVALMRKLARAYWYAAKNDQPFDFAKIFPGKPLTQATKKRDRRRPKNKTSLGK